MRLSKPMLIDLHTYYDEHGIGALGFACPHHHECAADSPRFTTAKEAYIGPEYEAGTLPRLLFLSLDSGSADANPATKTLEANRAGMRTASVASSPKGRHWYETHELAWFLLRSFKPGLTIDRIGPYFAHTNSAKCCQNNPGRAVAAETLFRNCRAFIPAEVRILKPDILVTQGDYARDAVNGAFEVESRQAAPGGTGECKATVLRLSESQRAIWLHTYHPSAYGKYWGQKNVCWPFFAQAVAEFVADRWPSSETRPKPAEPKPTAEQGGTPPRRFALPPRPASPSKAGWRSSGTGDGNLHMLVAAFNTVFRVNGRPFGTPLFRYEGVSDDAKGVQWNAGLDRERGTAWLGVNLEGMAYDGWPIARLIERELDHPTLADLCSKLPDAAMITTSWTRDAWQAAARLPIAEIQLGDTPTTLDKLDPDKWHTILLDAYGCLDADKNHRGRAKQTVTLRSGKVEKWVSPRLHFSWVLWRAVPRSQDEAEALVRRGREALEPVYRFVRDRSS